MPRINTHVVALAVLFGCPGPGTGTPTDGPTVQGRVTDRSGAQGRLAGSGTLAATSTVESHAVGSDGSLTFFAETELAADGSYTLEIPADAEFVVVQAVDGSGEALGSVVVEPMESEERTASPLDVETSTEALVWLRSGAVAEHWAHVRTRIDSGCAETVRGSADVETELDALADATAASAEAQLESWTRAGLDATALAESHLRASATLSAELAAETEAAYEAYLEALAEAESEAGATAEDRATVEADAALAFRATLRAHGATDLLDATAAQTTSAEARAWTQASGVLLETAGASQATLDQASTASASFEAEASASASVEAAAEAAADYRSTLVGSSSVEGSLLGESIGADVVTEAALDAAVDAAVSASAALESSVQASADAAVAADFDAEAFAVGAVDAMATHRSTLKAELDTILVGIPAAEASADLVVSTHSSFQAL